MRALSSKRNYLIFIMLKKWDQHISDCPHDLMKLKNSARSLPQGPAIDNDLEEDGCIARRDLPPTPSLKTGLGMFQSESDGDHHIPHRQFHM